MPPSAKVLWAATRDLVEHMQMARAARQPWRWVDEAKFAEIEELGLMGEKGAVARPAPIAFTESGRAMRKEEVIEALARDEYVRPGFEAFGETMPMSAAMQRVDSLTEQADIILGRSVNQKYVTGMAVRSEGASRAAKRRQRELGY